MTFFGLKIGSGFGELDGMPYQEFPGVPPLAVVPFDAF